MDKEALQRQLEDMEEESERWRTEKRRLNAEIDKLEAALADAKDTPGRKRASAPAGKPDAMDPVVLAKIQEAAEQKVNHAREQWERERAKLMSEINRLEGAVADAIARASNPLRVTQPVKEQFEVELNRVAKEKTEVEQAFLRAKTQWEQERLKMTREVVKLRSAAQIMGRPVPNDDSLESNPKVRDLEGHLKDNLAQWNAERSRLIAQVQKHEEAARRWDAERRQLNAHAGQLQQAYMQAEAKIQSYEVASRKQNPSEAHVEELKREKDTMQRQSMQARMAWDEERRKLSSQIEQLEQQLQRVSDSRDPVSNEVVDQLRLQYEKKLQEAIQQKTQLSDELQHASKLLENERARLSAAQNGTGTSLDNEEIAAEVARVEGQLSEIVAVIDNPNTELSTVIRKNVEKAELDAYLKGILFTLGKK
jgi:chromosome segregation ATPase